MSGTHVPLAVTVRAGHVEGLHTGSVAVCDADGILLSSRGDSSHPTFFRSSSKMLQALSVVSSGAAERFSLTLPELALTCASHNGADDHLRAAESILAKCGCSVTDLGCGAHEPYDRVEMERLLRAGEAPTAIHNNCSGKHSGMLAVCKAEGWPTQGYTSLEHPLQQRIHEQIATYSGTPRADIPTGIDGCSLPTFLLTIRAMSTAVARFMRASCREGTPDATIRAAIAAHPEMINGVGGFDTEIVRVTRGRLIAKRGAMAVFVVGADDPVRGPVGVTVKLASGDPTAMPVAVMHALEANALLSPGEIAQLESFRRTVIRNWNEIETGAVEAVG